MDSPPGTVVLDAPIIFDSADGQPSHAPMVIATVHGVSTRLILDTGSSVHILTMELAEKLRLERQEGEAGTDSTGSPVSSWSLGEQPVEIGGVEFTLRDLIGIQAPSPFQGWGIGGFISPQQLHPSAWTVLDLAGERLVVVDADETRLAAWLSARASALQLLRLRREPGDGTIQVRAAIEPWGAVTTMLDTGGKGTELVESVAMGAVGGSQQVTGHGVGGSVALGSLVTERTLAVGGARIPVRRLILRDSMEDHDALVGMDVLRGTVLAVNADTARPVFWMVPR